MATSDTEPAIFAFRSSVAEECKAEVTTEDAVNVDKPSNALVENMVMLLCAASSERLSATLKVEHKRNSEKSRQSCRGWWNTRGAITICRSTNGITKQDIDEFGATEGCPGCNAIKQQETSAGPLRSLPCSDRRMLVR